MVYLRCIVEIRHWKVDFRITLSLLTFIQATYVNWQLIFATVQNCCAKPKHGLSSTFTSHILPQWLFSTCCNHGVWLLAVGLYSLLDEVNGHVDTLEAACFSHRGGFRGKQTGMLGSIQSWLLWRKARPTALRPVNVKLSELTEDSIADDKINISCFLQMLYPWNMSHKITYWVKLHSLFASEGNRVIKSVYLRSE